MLKSQCISVTKLRTKTKECLEDLARDPKFIFVNNEPIAVLLDIQEYEAHFVRPRLRELRQNEITPALKKEIIAIKRKTKKSDLIQI